MFCLSRCILQNPLACIVGGALDANIAFVFALGFVFSKCIQSDCSDMQAKVQGML